MRVLYAYISKRPGEHDEVTLYTNLPNSHYPYSENLKLKFTALNGEEYVKKYFGVKPEGEKK